MPKNIVIFSDGTGQEGGKGSNTNIYRMFNIIENRTPGQISFYDRGLGTGMRKITGNAIGAGISKNIKDCYSFIFENYEAGDKIYLFGFSRGATTVRSLSGFIHYFGILPKSRPELIDAAYKIYKITNEEKRKRKAKVFLSQHHTMWTKVHFLGCYDTVAALGVPMKAIDIVLTKVPAFRHKFHNLELSECVENAYHALAIDDERKTFHPVLWDEKTRPHQTMKQVWFCGMHTDVGGGYKEHDLSDIPLSWMKKMASQHGLRIYKDIPIEGDVNGHMHNSRGSRWTKMYKKETRFWDSNRTDRPIVHASVLERVKNVDNQTTPPYKPWLLEIDYEVEQ